MSHGPPRDYYGQPYGRGPPPRDGRYNPNEEYYDPYDYYGQGANMQYNRPPRYGPPPTGYRGGRMPPHGPPHQYDMMRKGHNDQPM